jgi:exosortase
MDATERVEIEASPASQTASSGPSLMEEVQNFWRALPDKAVAAGLLAGWILLFQYFGYTVAGHGASLFDWMWSKWSDPSNDASHGKLIPFVVLAILWARRQRFLEAASRVWWPGLIALGLALMLHLVATVVQQPRLGMVALFSGVWAITGLVWGWKCAKLTFFPLAIFGFCVPMGGTFAQGLTLPLRLYAAKATFGVTHGLLDINVIRDGTQLRDPLANWRYDVAAECSGIRSFIALLAITTILAGLTMNALWKKAVIVSLSIPLSLLCNVMRLTTIILIANAYKSQAAGHMVDLYFGYVTYGVAVGSVLLVGRWLRNQPPKAKASP